MISGVVPFVEMCNPETEGGSLHTRIVRDVTLQDATESTRDYEKRSGTR